MNIYVPASDSTRLPKIRIKIGLTGCTCAYVHTPPTLSWSEKLNCCIRASTNRAVIVALEGANVSRRLIEVVTGMYKNRYRFIYFVNNNIICIDKFYLQQVGLFDPTFESLDFACWDMAIRFYEKDCAVYEGTSPSPLVRDYYSLTPSDLYKFKRKWKPYKNGFRRLRPEKLPQFYTDEFQNRVEPTIQNAEMSVFAPTQQPCVNLNCLCVETNEATQKKISTNARIEGFRLNEI